ncbi:MAG: ECF transporter S component [Clostridia bacterium]
MREFSVRHLVLAALFLALGLVLPFLTAQIPSVGSMLLPMHIPVLLCGFVCGWPYGLIIGFVTPLLRSALFGMPPIFPTAVAMAFELAAYGCATGLLYRLLPKKSVHIYTSLVLSMIVGRIVWGVASLFLYGIGGKPFTWEIFMAGAFINAIPGIVIQLILIPVVLLALKKGKLMEDIG